MLALRLFNQSGIQPIKRYTFRTGVQFQLTFSRKSFTDVPKTCSHDICKFHQANSQNQLVGKLSSLPTPTLTHKSLVPRPVGIPNFSSLSGDSIWHNNFWWPVCRQDGHAAGCGPSTCTEVRGDCLALSVEPKFRDINLELLYL